MSTKFLVHYVIYFMHSCTDLILQTVKRRHSVSPTALPKYGPEVLSTNSCSVLGLDCLSEQKLPAHLPEEGYRLDWKSH